MSRVHEPTIGDQTAGMQETIRVLDLNVDTFTEYVAALEQRHADNTDQLAAISERMQRFGPDAHMLRIRVAIELEQQECERALARVGVSRSVTQPAQQEAQRTKGVRGAPDGGEDS